VLVLYYYAGNGPTGWNRTSEGSIPSDVCQRQLVSRSLARVQRNNNMMLEDFEVTKSSRLFTKADHFGDGTGSSIDDANASRT